MSISVEFPDFPQSSLPTIPSEWECTAWHNDACPSWSTSKGHHVFVDYPETSEREFPESGRFTVSDIDNGDVLYHGDDWNEVISLTK